MLSAYIVLPSNKSLHDVIISTGGLLAMEVLVSDYSNTGPQAARFGSFFLGLVFAFAMLVFAGLLLERSVRNADWRQCAPAQNGHELVSTTQWDDHVDCFYQKIDPRKGRAEKLGNDSRT